MVQRRIPYDVTLRSFYVGYFVFVCFLSAFCPFASLQVLWLYDDHHHDGDDDDNDLIHFKIIIVRYFDCLASNKTQFKWKHYLIETVIRF